MLKYAMKFLCALLSLTMLVGCTTTSTTEESSGSTTITFADTIMWDAEYDVVVAGFGAGGSASSIYAAEEGAEVLILEKMPQGQEGGNTKVCGGAFAYGSGDYESTLEYFKALYMDHEYDEKQIEILAEGVAFVTDQISKDFNIPIENFFKANESGHPILTKFSPENPELPGSIAITGVQAMGENKSKINVYDMYKEKVFENSDNIDIWYESPAVELIQDPISKTIIGIKAERDGKTLNIRAINGVVLATGGFENNTQMVSDYLGIGVNYELMGAESNTGDGIKMAQAVGADLWHMSTYESGAFYGGMSFFSNHTKTSQLFPDGDHNTIPENGAMMIVGNGGQRYFNETGVGRHGRFYTNDSWKSLKYPDRSYVIMDQEYYDLLLSKDNLLGDYPDSIYKADTLEQLAQDINVDVDNFMRTVENFNKYKDQEFDDEFLRNTNTMEKFTEGPFYAVYVVPSILNTQGGPRKNENSEVLNSYGNVIPNLYVAGELGGITNGRYQGGINMTEALIFGEIAGRNAALEKEPLPAYTIESVESSPAQPGEITDYGKEAVYDFETGENEYIGIGKGFHGDVVIKGKVEDNELVSIEVLQHTETEGVGDIAIEELPEKIIEAQSTEIDVISHATYTSKAIFEAVEDILNQAK